MSSSAPIPGSSGRNVGELPIVALINSKIDHAPSGGTKRDYRRRSERIRRTFPATLEYGDRRAAVQSLEIGYGGMSLLSTTRARPPIGGQVTVLIKVGGKAYRDDFRVVSVQVVPEGTRIRLSLASSTEPAAEKSQQTLV